jgi:sRNA-binding carbon storage regulator CsrA
MEKAELIITALQQRIGELVSNYETQVAILRAEITQIMQDQEEKKKAVDEYSQSLSEKTNSSK